MLNRSNPIGAEIARLAGRIADEFPTPLTLPPAVQKIRKALGLSPTGHLILTTNHAAATLSPWNIGRILIGEGLARNLRSRGVEATAVVLPLDHNTLGDINRPGLIFLGGRSWKWPGLPRDPRRVVSTIDLQNPKKQWFDRIRQTLLQDSSKARAASKRIGDGSGRIGTFSPDEAETAIDRVFSIAFDRPESFSNERGHSGRADSVWSRMQKDLLSSSGFSATVLCEMSKVETLMAQFAPWPAGSWDEISRASVGLGEASWDWPGSLFWSLCDRSCDHQGMLQATHRSEQRDTQLFRCRSCGRQERITPQSAAKSIAEGRLHPRVHLLVLWLRRGLAPIIHTAGPQMIAYAPAVTALEKKMTADSELPPQAILPVGSLVPAIILTPLFTNLLGRLQKFSAAGYRGRTLWKGVVDTWAQSEWAAVEKRLGPRLRDGGFGPAPKGTGTLEAALRDWGWWPPRPSDPESGISFDQSADLVDGFLAWSHPFRWAGGWDWLYSGLTADRALERLSPRSLEDLSFSARLKPPRAPRAMIRCFGVPEGPRDGSLVHSQEILLEELLSDPPEEMESSASRS